MNDLWFYINLLVTLGLLPVHLAAGPLHSSHGRKVMLGLMLVWMTYCVGLGFQSDVRLRDVMLALASYSVALFVWLSDVLMTGGGPWLTKKRGERWTKEIDYVYLTLGACGLIASLGQLQNVSDKFTPPSMLGPFLVATAIVLRAIKTRAEIGGWNKPNRKRTGHAV